MLLKICKANMEFLNRPSYYSIFCVVHVFTFGVFSFFFFFFFLNVIEISLKA